MTLRRRANGFEPQLVRNAIRRGTLNENCYHGNDYGDDDDDDDDDGDDDDDDAAADDDDDDDDNGDDGDDHDDDGGGDHDDAAAAADDDDDDGDCESRSQDPASRIQIQRFRIQNRGCGSRIEHPDLRITNPDWNPGSGINITG